MEPGYTRGNAGGAQLQDGAIEPRAAEGFEVEASAANSLYSTG